MTEEKPKLLKIRCVECGLMFKPLDRFQKLCPECQGDDNDEEGYF